MTRLHLLRDAAASVAILRALPDMLREARALAEVSAGHEREEAFALYGVMCKFAHTAAHSLGHPELAAIACDRAAWAAGLSGDPVLGAVAGWMRAWDMWATADWGTRWLCWTRLSAISKGRMPGAISSRCGRGDRCTCGLRCQPHGPGIPGRHGTGSPMPGRPPADAEAGPPVFDRHSLTFSSGNVAVHAVAVALESGDQRRALELNARTDPGAIAALPRSRQGHHHLDLARAWLWDGNRDKALAELEKAEHLAPQLIRHHPMARSTLRSLVHAERSSTRERLRRMSDRFHLDG